MPAFPAARETLIPADGALGLRPAGDGDLEFFRTLYRSFRAEEMAATPWPEAARRAFLDDQFRLQHQHFTTVFADADFLVVEQAGSPVGRLYLQRGPDAFLVVDIGLLPQVRRQGLGRALMTWVLDQARAAGAARVELHVLVQNLPARRLYEALGFVVAETDGVRLRMACATGGAAS
jgi:ribosomal protein S18 acetylase RimI-like enzyme